MSLSAFPGMDEIVSLLHINKQAKERNFERVIIDAAPTGETIPIVDDARYVSLVCGTFVALRGRDGEDVTAVCGSSPQRPGRNLGSSVQIRRGLRLNCEKL